MGMYKKILSEVSAYSRQVFLHFFSKYKIIAIMDIPNGHTMSNFRRFDVDIMAIHRRANFDEFARHFRVLFRCNIDGRKIHDISTYFFRWNFNGRKIHVLSTYFYQCNFDGRNLHVVFTYFFRRNFDEQRFDIIFGKL